MISRSAHFSLRRRSSLGILSGSSRRIAVMLLSLLLLLLLQQRLVSAMSMSEASEDITKKLQNILKHHTALAGKVSPVKRSFQSILKNREQVEDTLRWLQSITHFEDLVFLVLAGWFTVPSLYLPYEVFNRTNKNYYQSKTHILAENIQHICRIALAVYVVDLMRLFLVGVGLDFDKLNELPHVFAQIAYTIWAANRFKRLKKTITRRYISSHPETFGRVQLVSRLVNAALYAITGLIVLTILKVEMGVALHSVLALGSVGTVAVGLASQGITAQILNGLMLASSDRIYEGDRVRFGNGLKGTILKLGWMETVLRGSDEITVCIPNADLVKQQISNLSRVRFSQVKQTLRFKYKEASKFPELLQSIKEEIRICCPELITDGSRPFRASWTDYAPNYLEVVVVAHFKIRPIGEEYWNNRQRVLQAIDRAVKICQVEYA